MKERLKHIGSYIFIDWEKAIFFDSIVHINSHHAGCYNVLYSSLLPIWAVTCDFKQCCILASVDSDQPVQTSFKLLSLETLNDVQSVAYIQATSKSSDQTGRMRRLIWGLVDRTYHIVGNLMSWLIY